MRQNLNKVCFIILGRIPSKKNSRNIFSRGGKLFNIPSKRYLEWHKSASLQIMQYKVESLIRIIDCIELYFYAPDKRPADLTNKAESILDLLIDAKVIEDDNWFNLNKVVLCFKGVDKNNPRCEIIIWCGKQRDKNDSS